MFVSRCNLEAVEGAPRVFFACAGAPGEGAAALLTPGCLRLLFCCCVEKVDVPGIGGALLIAPAELTAANPFWGAAAFEGSSWAPDTLLEAANAFSFFGFDFGNLPAASISRSSSRSSA